MAEAEQAAKRVLYLAVSPEVEGVSGKYYGDKKELASPKQSYDKATARRLWQVSEQLAAL
jgi:hypothetical protein